MTFHGEDIIDHKLEQTMTKSRIVIAGGSGMIGEHCRKSFEREGYEVIVLTRKKHTAPGEISWDPNTQWFAEDVISGADAVINLCGLSLADRRWTKRYKQQLFESRIIPTTFLNSIIQKSTDPPRCYIGASGIGIYGDHGTAPVHDDSTLEAIGFVVDLVKAWERAHAEIQNTRVVVLRIGVVLASRGGFMGKLIPPSRFGLFPYFGSGKQILSWIHIDDLTQMMLHAIRTPEIKGIYHATAPGSVPQIELMRTFKKVSGHNGLLMSVPSLALKLILGELSSVIFESANVQPDKMIRSGYQHRYPDIQSALEAVVES